MGDASLGETALGACSKAHLKQLQGSCSLESITYCLESIFLYFLPVLKEGLVSLKFPWGILTQPLLQFLFPPSAPAAPIWTGRRLADILTLWMQGKGSSFSIRTQKP